MRDFVVMVDADACVPAALVTELGILTAPLDPTPYLENEPPIELRTAAAPIEPAGAIQAFARAVSEAPAVLYVGAGDGYGGSRSVQDAVQAVAAMSPMRRQLRLHPSDAALMGCGWQAVAAARAAGDGLAAAEAAAAAVRTDVEVISILEFPQFADVQDERPNAMLQARPLVQLRGERLEVIARLAKRELALVALRERFALAARGGDGPLHVAVHHAGAAAAAEAMAEWVRRHFEPAEVVVAPLTRHAATRLGPRMVGLAWYREEH